MVWDTQSSLNALHFKSCCSSAVSLGCISSFFLSGKWNPLEYFKVCLCALWLCCTGAEVSKIKLSLVRLKSKITAKQKQFLSWKRRECLEFQAKPFPDSWTVRVLCFGRSSSEQNSPQWFLSGLSVGAKSSQLVPHGKVIKWWNKRIKYSPLSLWNCPPPPLKQDF